MITNVIDLIIDNPIPTKSEYVKIARGKYKNPTTFKEVLKKALRKLKNIE